MSIAALVVAIAALAAVVYLLGHHVATKPSPLQPLPPIHHGKMGQEPWSSLGPNTGNLAVSTGSTIPANFIRTEIELSLDTAVASGVVYGLLNPGSGPGQTGTPSVNNFHFVLYVNQPPFQTEYTGAIGLVASTGTIHVGVVEH